MSRVLPALALAGALVVAATGCSAPSAARHPRPAKPPVSYYLSLGDSLAQGVQPGRLGASVRTRDGYANLLYTALRRHDPGLRLVKLGCPGETTVTMINGGICHYRGGSQLAAAASFLRAHRGQVSLITLDIGANDGEACAGGLSPVRLASCATRSIPHALTNLSKILARLREADPGGHIIAMNYYLPSLALWRNGMVGEGLARVSEVAASAYNALLIKTYTAFGVRVANVFGAFHTSDFGQPRNVPGIGELPRNVAAICQWTWECAAPPRGPNQHANLAGYQVIARAFLLAGAGKLLSRPR
jgi:lysophospholipase L1-like esterase